MLPAGETVIWWILAYAFLVRALPRVWLKDAVTSDTYYHLFCAREIRDNRFRLPPRCDRIRIAHENSYPFLYHYLLALVPERTRNWLERLTGAIFDTASVFVAWQVSLWYFRQSGAAAPGEAAIWVAALYAAAPALLRIGSGPRAYNGSPRPVGQALYLVHATCAIYAYSSQDPYALAASVLAGALTVITAKFATQVLLFFGAVFAITVSWTYLLVLAGVFLAALLLTSGKAFIVLKGQLKHSIFYVRHLQRVYVWNEAGWKEYVRRALGALKVPGLRGKTVACVLWFINDNYWPHLLLFVFPIALAPLFLVPQIVVEGRLAVALLAWVLAGAICFLLTSYKHLRFLGEPERYLEFSLMPATLLTVACLVEGHQATLVALLACSLALSILYVVAYLRSFLRFSREFDELTAMSSKARGLPSGVAWTPGSYNKQLLFFFPMPVLTYGIGNFDESLMPFAQFDMLFGRFPFPTAGPDVIAEHYHFDYLFAEKSELQSYRSRFEDGFSRIGLELLLETPSFVLYRRK